METPAALVTGGATRLGRYFAEALADKGFDIALHVNSSGGKQRKWQTQFAARVVSARFCPATF